ncbi:hypothetical protein M8C21_018567, partial [Ambrosia artemisiifolia]
FMAALANDITVVKTLPKSLKGARRKKEIPSFKVGNSQSPYYYVHHVLPALKRHSVVELVVSDGGCLQKKKMKTNLCCLLYLDIDTSSDSFDAEDKTGKQSSVAEKVSPGNVISTSGTVKHEDLVEQVKKMFTNSIYAVERNLCIGVGITQSVLLLLVIMFLKYEE